MHEISLLCTTYYRPIYRPNPETGSRDPGITNFSIPDPGIKISIPGLQSLVPSFNSESHKGQAVKNGVFATVFYDKLKHDDGVLSTCYIS